MSSCIFTDLRRFSSKELLTSVVAFLLTCVGFSVTSYLRE